MIDFDKQIFVVDWTKSELIAQLPVSLGLQLMANTGRFNATNITSFVRTINQSWILELRKHYPKNQKLLALTPDTPVKFTQDVNDFQVTTREVVWDTGNIYDKRNSHLPQVESDATPKRENPKNPN